MKSGRYIMKNILFMSWFKRKKKNPQQLDTDVANGLRNLTVLVVDDSRTQLYAMEKMLHSVGMNTITAENGKQAILMARHRMPDIILMDIVMPEINGFQATRYLSRQPDTQHIPIIIVSGSNQESDKAWGLKLGARDFMQKPVDKELLMTKIRLLLRDRPAAVPADEMHDMTDPLNHAV